jgi:SAM-dependent methyltransferase
MSYSSDYFTTRESWRDWRIEAQWLINAARVTHGAHVLEIGCGGGGLLRMMCERGACAVGVDTLETALKLARDHIDAWGQGRRGAEEKSPLRPSSSAPLLSLIQIDEDNTLPFRDASFDAIVAQHAIEHLPDVEVALREWKRLLVPNGRIALATPNALYPDPAHFADADHTRIFSPTELRDAVQHAGFVVKSCYTFFPFLSRLRALRAFSVMAYRIFQHAPYFASHGRTIMLSARKS